MRAHELRLTDGRPLRSIGGWSADRGENYTAQQAVRRGREQWEELSGEESCQGTVTAAV